MFVLVTIVAAPFLPDRGAERSAAAAAQAKAKAESDAKIAAAERQLAAEAEAKRKAKEEAQAQEEAKARAQEEAKVQAQKEAEAQAKAKRDAELARAEAAKKVEMPDVVGLTLSLATDVLQNSGLTNATVCETPGGEMPWKFSNWRVVTQSVEPGKLIPAGREVCLGAIKKEDL